MPNDMQEKLSEQPIIQEQSKKRNREEYNNDDNTPTKRTKTDVESSGPNVTTPTPFTSFLYYFAIPQPKKRDFNVVKKMFEHLQGNDTWETKIFNVLSLIPATKQQLATKALDKYNVDARNGYRMLNSKWNDVRRKKIFGENFATNFAKNFERDSFSFSDKLFISATHFQSYSFEQAVSYFAGILSAFHSIAKATFKTPVNIILRADLEEFIGMCLNKGELLRHYKPTQQTTLATTTTTTTVTPTRIKTAHSHVLFAPPPLQGKTKTAPADLLGAALRLPSVKEMQTVNYDKRIAAVSESINAAIKADDLEKLEKASLELFNIQKDLVSDTSSLPLYKETLKTNLSLRWQQVRIHALAACYHQHKANKLQSLELFNMAKQQYLEIITYQSSFDDQSIDRDTKTVIDALFSVAKNQLELVEEKRSSFFNKLGNIL